jgi:glycosyl transferase family 25
MKSFVIYLEEHELGRNRIPQLIEDAKTLGWDIEPFPGVNGLTVDWGEQKIKIDERNNKSFRTMEHSGVKGCFLSHLLLWKKCIELNEPIGIFEYDIDFQKGPPEPTDIDIVKLSGFDPKPFANTTGQWWVGTHAYIVSPQGAKKLCDWVETWGASPSDWLLGTNVVDVEFDDQERVSLGQYGSTTKHLAGFLN